MKFANALVLSAALSFLVQTPALAVDTINAQEFKISRIGDVDKTCNELSAEATRMQHLIADVEQSQNASEMQGYGVSAATGIGGFLIGTVTGGIGFAAAGLLASEAIDSNVEDAQEVKDALSQRRSLMVGIYQAKDCKGPIEHVLVDAPEKQAQNIPDANKRQNRTPRYND